LKIDKSKNTPIIKDLPEEVTEREGYRAMKEINKSKDYVAQVEDGNLQVFKVLKG